MKEVFELAPPAGHGAILVSAFPVLLLAGLLLMFGYMLAGSRRASCVVSSEALVIRTPMYGRTIALGDLDLERATAGPLSRIPDDAPSWRTNGIGLPGYQAGWFRSKGGEKLLAVLTDREHVVSIPTRLGYRVLLSVAAPERMLRALRTAAAR